VKYICESCLFLLSCLASSIGCCRSVWVDALVIVKASNCEVDVVIVLIRDTIY